MGVKRARRARYRRGDHRRQHEVARDVDPDGRRERLVFAQRDHGAARTRADQAADDHVADNGDAQDEPVIRGFFPEDVLAQSGQPQRQRRNIVERHRALRELDPVECDQSHHLGEADRDDDEVGAAHLEGKPADEPAAGPGSEDRGEDAAPHRLRRHREHRSRHDVHAESERDQRAGVGADAEESDMTEGKLPRIAEQQVQAHGRNDEDAGDDEDVQHVLVAHPERQREQEQQPQRGEELAHPMRSFCANRPVGLKTRIRMMSTNPIASR